MGTWALGVLSRALEALARETEPRVFKALKPHLTGGPAYAETAQAHLRLAALNRIRKQAHWRTMA